MKDLVERVAKSICVGTEPDAQSPFDGSRLWQRRTPEARAAILATLAHFNEHVHVTDKMALAGNDRLPMSARIQTSTMKFIIAAAMRAALEEFK